MPNSIAIDKARSQDSSASVSPSLTQTENRNRAFEIYKRLLEKQVSFLGTSISDEVADSIFAQLP